MNDSPMPNAAARRVVRDRLDALGLTAKEASIRAGLNVTYVQQFLKKGIPAALPEYARERIAAVLDVSPDLLKSDKQSMAQRFREVVESQNRLSSRVRADVPLDGPQPAPSFHALPLDVPVRGTARGDNDGKGDFTFNGENVGYARRLPGLTGIKNAFALYVHGSSMSPWREEGGVVYVNPDRPARIGDHVIVEMNPTVEGEAGVVWLKKLIGRSPDGSLILRQYNPPDEKIKVPGARVLRVYRVVEWEELIN